ncbi:MAG: YicC family protein [Desulfobacteraceae bacterium]|nr:YicC family protein [Desulfobacteraceae bacterium]
MIKSMTAYSGSSVTFNHFTCDITIRSYNHRFLDFAMHLPDICKPFEEDMKKIISQHQQRGRIEVKLSLLDDSKDADLFEVDEQRAQSYYTALDTLKSKFMLVSDISLSNLLSGKNMILPIQKEMDEMLLWQTVSKATNKAAKGLDGMRKKEGKSLEKDLKARIKYIEKQLKKIQKEAVQIPEIYKKRLEDRISKLTADIDVLDPVRLAQEAAILSDKSDVSEEIVRIYSHINQFKEILKSKQSQGRKLNFLIQEFNREFNTIGSKAGNALLQHLVVDLKSELEKIREQVQNIE